MTVLQTKMTRMAMLAVCSAALTAPLAVLAQDTPPPPPPAQDGGGPGGHHDHGDRAAEMKDRETHQLEAMTKKLNLTADQQTQIKQVYADSDAKMAALFSDDSTPMKEKHPKMMAIMQDRQSAIRNVLTPEQQPKFDEMQAKMKEHMQDHKHGGGPGGPGGDNAPPPPPQQ
jgi:protein CpxP